MTSNDFNILSPMWGQDYYVPHGTDSRPILRRQNATREIRQPRSAQSNCSWVSNPSQIVLNASPGDATGGSTFSASDYHIVDASVYSWSERGGMNAISSRSPRPVKSPNEIGLVQSPVSESFNATPAVVSNCMSISAITQLLVAHRCQDVTKYIDPSSYDEFPISGGGFGDIYRGRVLDGTQVAIKRSRFLASTTAESQKILKRSAHELYVWSKYNHPNLLRLIGFAQFRGQIAMVSPWMENGNLSEYIARNPGADRCRFCVQVCEGVTYLHSMNNVHGDLKAANVVVSREGIAKITDFGNTRLQDYTLQFAPTSKGLDFSLRWTAPELVSEQPAALSNESDVYALGMTILEVITGQVPFAGLSEFAVLAAVVHRNQIPKRPDSFIPYESSVGDLLWRTLESCWATDPKARATAASVRNTMEKITHRGLLRRDSYVIVNQ